MNNIPSVTRADASILWGHALCNSDLYRADSGDMRTEQRVLQARLPAVRVERLEFQPMDPGHQRCSTLPLKSLLMRKPINKLRSGIRKSCVNEMWFSSMAMVLSIGDCDWRLAKEDSRKKSKKCVRFGRHAEICFVKGM